MFNVRDERDQPFFIEDVPFLVGEYDFGALDRGKFFRALVLQQIRETGANV